MDTQKRSKEETLDPQDWQAMRELGRRMVDDMIAYLQTVRERPVWQPTPERSKAHLQQAAPRAPQAPEGVYQDFLDHVQPYPLGNIHPRFWGWVIGTGTPLGALAEMLAAGMNSNLGGGEHAANYVEQQVLDWCKEMLGYPAEAGGLLVSGGSMANFVGLAVARNAMAGYDIRQEGLHGTGQQLVVYGSAEIHSSIQKAIELLGIGNGALRKVPVDSRFRIELSALQETVAKDRANGLRPICVVGSAGTVNTAAFDDLQALADFCERQKLWFHVDGAFGALAALSPALRHLVAGMERADSLAFDLHKWMYVPYEAGCVLVRDREAHRRAFSLTPEYLAHDTRGVAAGANWFSDYGVELSRGFRALKIWMSIKAHGLDTYARLIQQNVDQARYLGGLVEAAPELELLAPVALNIVCFRFKAADVDDAACKALNKEILLQLHESGIAVPSGTLVDGRYAIRVAIVNHRSRFEDFDLLIRETIRLGKTIRRESK